MQEQNSAGQPEQQFNELTPTEHEALSILMEECSEVCQVIGKILRHGLESDALGKFPHSNRLELEKEIADVGISLEVLFNLEVLSTLRVGNNRAAKLSVIRQSPERFHHIPPEAFPRDW